MMAEFKSKYPELGFYVGDAFKSFKNGVFKTDNEDEIKVLSGISRSAAPGILHKERMRGLATTRLLR